MRAEKINGTSVELAVHLDQFLSKFGEKIVNIWRNCGDKRACKVQNPASYRQKNSCVDDSWCVRVGPLPVVEFVCQGIALFL